MSAFGLAEVAIETTDEAGGSVDWMPTLPVSPEIRLTAPGADGPNVGLNELSLIAKRFA
jgi:hypothetical protein